VEKARVPAPSGFGLLRSGDAVGIIGDTPAREKRKKS